MITLKGLAVQKVDNTSNRGGGGGGVVGYCHIWAIQVCAAVKGMVFKQFTLGQGI